MKKIMFTIILSNYMAQAAVLFESAKKHLKDFVLLIYVLDCKRAEKEKLAAFAAEHGIAMDLDFLNSLRFSDDIKRIDMAERTVRYGPTELCTSVKASIFLELISEFGKGKHFSYFDPDIQFHSDCASFFEEAEKHSFYLIPHFIEPPEDDFLPKTSTILASGQYNFGYLGVNPAKGKVSEAILWWERRLERECIIDFHAQIFVDQKWGCFFADHPETGICLSPEYNAAYWNLHERHLAKTGNSLTASRIPLGFFHFSGYDPLKPLDMSKYQTRFCLKALPKVYQELFLSYADKLMSLGYERWQSFKPPKEPNSHSGQDGPDKDMFLLGLYRSPEDISHMRPLKAVIWTGALVLRKHIQLAKVFINTLIQNGSWRAVSDTAGQYVLCIRRFFKLLSQYNNSRQTYQNIHRFAVIGYFSDESGTGEGGRSIANTIFEISDDCCLYDISETSSSRKLANNHHKDRIVKPGDGDRIGTLIVAVNADRVNSLINSGYDRLFQKAGKKIGYWWWETEDFPRRWIHASYYFDEIWVATDFIKQTLEKALPVPVKLMPPILGLGIKQTSCHKEKPPYFLTVFDGYSSIQRKNPFGAITAFKKALNKSGNPSGARLVIKSINLNPEEIGMIKRAADGIPYTLVNEYLSQEKLHELIGGCTGFISLHRSEGLGLNIINAMLMEKPIIVTNYSGNTDFTNNENAYLVEGKYVETTMKDGVYQGSKWMEPDTDRAADAIAEILTQPDKASEKGRRARIDILRIYRPERSKELFRGELL